MSPDRQPFPVLVVDDHNLLATTLVLALRQQGIDAEATAVENREDLLNAVASRAPALVLLDLDLGPLGSGLHLVRPIVERGCQVVIVTGVIDRLRLAATVEAGAKAVIDKSTSFPDLVSAVRYVANGGELMTVHQREALLGELSESRRAVTKRGAPFQSLTAREQSVLAELVEGRAAETIAEDLSVSLPTVRTHIRSVLLKLGVRSQLAAVAMARTAGWPGPPGGAQPDWFA